LLSYPANEGEFAVVTSCGGVYRSDKSVDGDGRMKIQPSSDQIGTVCAFSRDIENNAMHPFLT